MLPVHLGHVADYTVLLRLAGGLERYLELLTAHSKWKPQFPLAGRYDGCLYDCDTGGERLEMVLKEQQVLEQLTCRLFDEIRATKERLVLLESISGSV